MDSWRLCGCYIQFKSPKCTRPGQTRRYRLFSSKTSGVSVNDKSYKVDIRDWVKISRHPSRFVSSWETYAVKTMENQSYKIIQKLLSCVLSYIFCWCLLNTNFSKADFTILSNIRLL